MANPIRIIKRMEVSEEERVARDVEEIKQAISANKQAILHGIETLAALNDGGLLEVTAAMVHYRKEIAKNVVQEINKPQYAGALHNLGQMLFLLGDLDIDRMETFTEKLNGGLAEMSATKTDEQTSYLGLLRALKDPEVNRSLTMLLHFLKGMGKESEKV